MLPELYQFIPTIVLIAVQINYEIFPSQGAGVMVMVLKSNGIIRGTLVNLVSSLDAKNGLVVAYFPNLIVISLILCFLMCSLCFLCSDRFCLRKYFVSEISLRIAIFSCFFSIDFWIVLFITIIDTHHYILHIIHFLLGYFDIFNNYFI